MQQKNSYSVIQIFFFKHIYLKILVDLSVKSHPLICSSTSFCNLWNIAIKLFVPNTNTNSLSKVLGAPNI